MPKYWLEKIKTHLITIHGGIIRKVITSWIYTTIRGLIQRDFKNNGKNFCIKKWYHKAWWLSFSLMVRGIIIICWLIVKILHLLRVGKIKLRILRQ